MSRYARPELERRFLMGGMPDGCVNPRRIQDRYIRGTRLRLRLVEHPDGTVDRKLGQKIRVVPDDPSRVQLTTTYLSADEYEVFAALAADTLAKTRHALEVAGRSVAVDVFAGALDGLVLLEASFDEAAAMSEFEPPSLAGREVTQDDRLSGGSLARLDPSSAAMLLDELSRS